VRLYSSQTSRFASPSPETAREDSHRKALAMKTAKEIERGLQEVVWFIGPFIMVHERACHIKLSRRILSNDQRHTPPAAFSVQNVSNAMMMYLIICQYMLGIKGAVSGATHI
jgi:hypothetical protein